MSVIGFMNLLYVFYVEKDYHKSRKDYFTKAIKV